MKLRNKTTPRWVIDRRIVWRQKNRHACQEIAKSLGVSQTMVRKVFFDMCASAGLRVERELASRGCPGFEVEEKDDAAA